MVNRYKQCAPVRLKNWVLPSVLIGSILFAGFAGAQDEERNQLQDQQKQLTKRIETLKREQDFLLFQKTAYDSDSKYLILNLTAMTGQLKYKNRLLKEFAFHPTSRRALREGMLRLTAKIEGKGNRSALVFDKTITFRIKGASSRSDQTPVSFLPKKDFLSLFAALETGTRAYILP